MSKQEWRVHFKEQLRQFKPWTNEIVVGQLNSHLTTYLSKQSGIWGIFQPMEQEPDLRATIGSCEHLQWVYPRMQNNSLRFYRAQGFVQGPFGVYEPDADAIEVPLEQISGILLPGLGFGKSGERLGKGKGFYDRALADYSGRKVGVCFSCQLTQEKMPTEEHDVKVQVVISEAGQVTVKDKGD